MATDLVARLRAPPKGANFVEVDEGNWAMTVYPFGELCHEAADEIERLERERSEWAGVAATRNRNIALIAEERDRMLNAITGYVRSSKAGEGVKAVWWWELQEIEKEFAERVPTVTPPDVSGESCERCGTYIHPGATHVCLR